MRKLLGMLLLASLLLAAIGPLGATAAGSDQAGKVDGFLQQMVQGKQPNDRVTVIVQHVPGKANRVKALVRELGARPLQSWSFIDALAVELPVRALRGLASSGDVRWISWDAPVGHTAVPEETKAASAAPFAIDADYAWRQGLSGAGVTVAVIDSGFTSALGYGGDARGRIKARWNVLLNSTNVTDLYGHGTHVAGIIASHSGSAGQKYPGIAPDVDLVIVKASTDAGAATEANLIDALQWLYDHRTTHRIRVVNLSVGSTVEQSYTTAPLNAAVQQLWFAGVVVVVSAGNYGPGSAISLPPANDPFVITVGAFHDKGTRNKGDDELTTFSTYGTTVDGFVKPDVYAPGRSIVSLGAGSGSVFHTECLTCVVDTTQFRLSGTSMAAPIISGYVALLLQANASLTPDQVKWLLISHQRSFMGQPAGGAGALDGRAALDAALSGSVSSANEGIAPNVFIGGGGTIEAGTNWNTAYWNTAYWNTAYWNSMYEPDEEAAEEPDEEP